MNIIGVNIDEIMSSAYARKWRKKEIAFQSLLQLHRLAEINLMGIKVIKQIAKVNLNTSHNKYKLRQNSNINTIKTSNFNHKIKFNNITHNKSNKYGKCRPKIVKSLSIISIRKINRT